MASHQMCISLAVDNLHKDRCPLRILVALRHAQIRDVVLDGDAFVLKGMLIEVHAEDGRRKVCGRDEPRRAYHR